MIRIHFYHAVVIININYLLIVKKTINYIFSIISNLMKHGCEVLNWKISCEKRVSFFLSIKDKLDYKKVKRYL